MPVYGLGPDLEWHPDSTPLAWEPLPDQALDQIARELDAPPPENEEAWAYITDPFQDLWECRTCGDTVAVGRDDVDEKATHRCPPGSQPHG